ncbi:hypothetical protein BC827DRAFT_1156497 [Russula dissimulans]|nr:hypothetical protein BC827DRAFT_1156497 [Russula dissimulans]
MSSRRLRNPVTDQGEASRSSLAGLKASFAVESVARLAKTKTWAARRPVLTDTAVWAAIVIIGGVEMAVSTFKGTGYTRAENRPGNDDDGGNFKYLSERESVSSDALQE